MRILLAEDDLRLGKLLQHMLTKEKMQVDWVTEGEQVYDYAMYSPYDLIILDWMMPGETGLSACSRLRSHGYQGIILMLTAKDALEDKILGLDTGVDDYVVKPFEFSELLARIRALSRRSPVYHTEDIVEIDNLIINRTTHLLTRNGVEIPLTGREFQILDLLVQNRGQVVPREVILDRIWGLEAEVTSNNLDAYIRLLRKKIDGSADKSLIHNVRGIGYKLEEPYV